MVRLSSERVLLIGDCERQVQSALLQAVPAAQVTAVATFFDAIAELSAGATPLSSPPPRYTTVFAAAEPIERRPEAAVRTLRELAGEGRIILFGHPTLELLSRKMLQFGCDDYIVTPASAAEVEQVLGTPKLRLTGPPAESESAEAATPTSPPKPDDAAAATEPLALAGLPLADLVLDALLNSPHDAAAAAVQSLNARLAELSPAMELVYQSAGPQGSAPPPLPAAARDSRTVLTHPVRIHGEDAGVAHLLIARDADLPPSPGTPGEGRGEGLRPRPRHVVTPDDASDEPTDAANTAARHLLSQLAHLLGKLAGLQQRHNGLQKLAITDELTGLYNARYFRHFLTRILERARKLHFPVTLLVFDIDDFKHYNDRYGHGVGDEILRQTGALMRRCTREHDLVARIGGDEFAVVFWDKEGPRVPREPRPAAPSRPPATPLEVFKRFKGLLTSDEFTVLGQSGQGVLGISAGMAVYPYDARDAATLIEEADKQLMQRAKKAGGKNQIFIVGTDDPLFPPEEAKP